MCSIQYLKKVRQESQRLSPDKRCTVFQAGSNVWDISVNKTSVSEKKQDTRSRKGMHSLLLLLITFLFIPHTQVTHDHGHVVPDGWVI